MKLKEDISTVQVAPISMSSAFWAIGKCFEIDVYEIVGKPKKDCEVNEFLQCAPTTSMPSCTHSDYNRDGYCKSTDLGQDLSADFHVYGADWRRNRIRFYADGVLVHTLRRRKGMKKGQWPKKDCNMFIWLDNEAFEWSGFPEKADLPSDYEVDYVRVWKRG
jgi:beta-glucanase (GH16 family)